MDLFVVYVVNEAAYRCPSQTLTPEIICGQTTSFTATSRNNTNSKPQILFKPQSTHPPNPPKTTVMADKLRTQQHLEALQTRHVGTGHADTTKFEWTSNIMRDTYASYVGHPQLLSYMALGMGESREKVRVKMIEKMVLPVGPPGERED